MSKALLLLLLGSFGVQAFAAEYNCKARYRSFTGDKVLEEKSVDMVVTEGNELYLRLESEINDMAFVASITKNDGSALLSIVKGPTYTSGINSRTSFSNGYASTSQIQETQTGVYTLYKLECYAR